MDLCEYKVSINSFLIEALKKINANSRGIVFVCDEEDKFCGTVTDGDIRRYLIKGGKVSDNVALAMNSSPYIVYSHQRNDKNYYKIMEEKLITAIPVLSQDGILIDAISIYDKRQEYKQIDVPVVIMAGGRGTRLQPYTDILPKPLIPIGNKTISEQIIEQFQKNGCNDFHMIVNYKKNFIKTYFAESEKNYIVNFYDEQDFYGTAGGLNLLSGIIKETFIMTNCDILIRDEYAKYLEQHEADGNILTIIAVEKKMQLPYGVLQIADGGQLIGIEEKPQFSFFSNTGFYIIEPQFLELIPKNTFIDMTDMVEKCIEQGLKVGTYIIDEGKWDDMGQMESLELMKSKFEY